MNSPAAPKSRVDTHHHVLPEFYKEAQREVGIVSSAYRAFPEWSVAKSLALMERQGIGTTILSFTSPGVYFGDLAKTRALTTRCNDFLAEIAARDPKRFGGFAFLPLPDVDASLKEIARVHDELGLDGVCLLTSIDDRYIGHADFEPVYAELDRRKAVVFIHPCYPPGKEARDYDLPRMLVDYPFETTKVAANLILHGVMERNPNIRFILSHAGGTLPMLAHRMAIFDKMLAQRENYRLGAMAYVKRFWFDTALSGDKTPLDALRAVADPSRILFGTDYPYIPDDVADRETRGFDAYAGFAPGEREMVERGNAVALFKRLRDAG
jgi:predicted TIM-barrel fold metal-dependent hydrolase